MNKFPNESYNHFEINQTNCQQMHVSHVPGTRQSKRVMNDKLNKIRNCGAYKQQVFYRTIRDTTNGGIFQSQLKQIKNHSGISWKLLQPV